MLRREYPILSQQSRKGVHALPYHRSCSSVFYSCLWGIFLASVIICYLDLRLSPLIKTMALTQTTNLLTQTITTHIDQENLDYAEFVTIERNIQGEITALTSNFSAMNAMRADLIATVLMSLEELDISVVEVPLGSLLNSELLWAKGPRISARAISVGTISAQFHSEFTHSGINQTLHRIYLQVSVPIYLIMAGDTLETTVETQLCVSEIVIVGKVPNTNLQMGALASGLFPSYFT